MIDKTKLIEQFSSYVRNFDFDDPIIALKYNHSLSVATFCEDIASSLALNEEETIIAFTIGLIHEIGSFENWKKTKTYQNTPLTLHILFEENLIEKFAKDDDTKKIVMLAIGAQKHDRLHLDEIRSYSKEFEKPKTKEDELIMYAKILADANTLDTFGMLKRKSFPFINAEYKKTTISPIVLKAFKTEHKVHTGDVKSFLDQIVYLLSLVYELNYDYSISFAKKIDFSQAIYDFYYQELSNDEQTELWNVISLYKNKH